MKRERNELIKQNSTSNLLKEHYADGWIDSYMASVKKDLSNLMDIYGNAFGLIVGDLSHLFKVTFGRLRSAKQWKQMRDNYKAKRQKRLEGLAKGMSNIIENTPDGAPLLACVAPDWYMSDVVLSPLKLTSSSISSSFETLGLQELPFVGGFIQTATESLDKMGNFDPTNAEDQKRISQMFSSQTPPPTNTTTTTSGDDESLISKAWDITQRIFLLSHYEITGTVLGEGEEEKTEKSADSKMPPIKSEEELWSFLVRRLFQENLENTDSEAFLKERDQYLEKVLGEALSLISLYSKAIGAQSADDFFDAMEQLDQKADGKAGVEGKKKEVYDKIEEMKTDKEAVGKFKKDYLKKNKNAKPEEVKEKYLEGLEQTVIKELVEGVSKDMLPSFEDLRDYITDEIMGGIDPKQYKRIQEIPAFSGLVAQIKKYNGKLVQAMAPIKK